MAKIFTDNVAFLQEAKEALAKYKETVNREEELTLQEKQQAKILSAEKKAVEDNVAGTIKKRRGELTAKYDTELSRIQDGLKKIRSQREKAKQKSMKERIEAQNAPFKDENREMHNKIRGLFRQDRVPSFCNSTLFYSIYYPGTVKEILVLLAVFAVCCVLIPCGLYSLLPQKRTLWLILIYVAGFMGLSEDVMEAASIDGASGWMKMRKIVLPLMMSSITICLFLTLSKAFMVYDVNLSLTSGGPYGTTQMAAMHVYEKAFTSRQFGVGQAEALILFIVVACISGLQVYLTKKQEVEA